MRSWTEKTPRASGIEHSGFESRIRPWLDKHFKQYEVIPADTKRQYSCKIDGEGVTNGGLDIAMEWKVVNGEYGRIFAEYKGVPKNRAPYDGWMLSSNKIGKPTILIYAMTKTVRVYNMDKLKAWYKTADKSKWKDEPHWDYELQQEMWGHLIPVSEIDRFLITEYTV